MHARQTKPGAHAHDELKSHPFLVHFSDLFLSKKTDLCAGIWNTSPNCCAVGNSKERRNCSKKGQKVAEQYCYTWLKETVAEKMHKDERT